MSTSDYPKGPFSNLPEILLVLGTFAALIWSNSPWSGGYQSFLHLPLGFSQLALSLHHWVNDGLMVVFFFLIGLEVKKELVIGHLSTRAKLIVPLSGAIGGMLVPGLVFVGFVWFGGFESQGGITAIRGWAIPAATDIAFALGVLRMVGKGLPPSLRVFLSTLAIADDLGAIIIIALFYSASINIGLLAAASVVIGFSAWLGKRGKLSPLLICALGLIVWICVLHSGVHATIAGVALAFTVPASFEKRSLMMRLEHGIVPYVNYFILPLFALCNAGLPLGGFSFELLLAPITLGVALGLFLGKQLGVWIGAHVPIWIVKDSHLPSGATAQQLYGVCILTGIGFTMSLFISALAYPADSLFSIEARVGVLLGSLLSVIFGALVLTSAKKRART